MPYSPLLIKPFREELTSTGFAELLTANDVDEQMKQARTGVTLVAVNSVSDSAAGVARPAARLALQRTSSRPGRLLTVFANQDPEATARLWNYLPGIPPSDPSFALFKDGELVQFISADRIQGRDAEAVAADLEAAFTKAAG